MKLVELTGRNGKKQLVNPLNVCRIETANDTGYSRIYFTSGNSEVYMESPETAAQAMMQG